MNVRRAFRGRQTESKTDRIASYFSARPLDSISPKDIARELDMDLQLVTSLVNRLRKEGLVERIGRGKYRLKLEGFVDESSISAINRDMSILAGRIFGELNPRTGGTSTGDPFRELVGLYLTLRKVGGEATASNLLKLCAYKRLEGRNVELLVNTIYEVVNG